MRQPLSHTKTHPHIELHARQMRSWQTPSESRLWSQLRARRLGVEFRRQVPLGGRYVVDFLAPARMLVVEVDGAHHASRRRADERRDRKLRRLGYCVLRLEADWVLRDLPAAVEQVRRALAEPP